MRTRKFLRLLLVATALLIGGHLIYLWSLRPHERYPADTFLGTVAEKRALIAVAHDDDAISCAGTIAALTQAGWTVDFLCFYVTPGTRWHDEVAERKEEMQRVARVEGLHKLHLIDMDLRQRLDTVPEPWMPVPLDRFATVFDEAAIDAHITAVIKDVRPTVIFTLDDRIGGYGHPEHVAVSKAVLRVCSALHEQGDSPVQRVYQAVFPPSLTERVNSKIPAYHEGKRIYGTDGMPPPDVEMSIVQHAGIKKDIMLAHASQHRNLKKFWPWYHWYPAAIYFRIFDKEHFRVIEV
ncbi:MAG: PIG-L family deacetylase [Flavobacteriales bacterium]|nr:PIG-L family deacetylase [Flavobacteriales bacterium]